VYRDALPQLGGELFLTNSGLQADLIFNQGFDLPEFAAFVLVDDDRGTAALEAHYRRHADIAVQHGLGVILDTPTFRASRDRASRIGYPAAGLHRVNRSAVKLLCRVRSGYRDAAAPPAVISGCITEPVNVRGQRARRHATARQAPIPPPVRHHKPCGSRAGTGHNLTKRAGVPASRHRLASDGASWLACQK
jgi:hypothetical protein